MKLRQTIKLALLGVLFGVASSVSANSDYYSKSIAKVINGNGKVYVATTNSDSGASYNDTESSATQEGKDLSSAPTHTYYYFAKPNDGYKFDGWFSDEACTPTNKVADKSPYEYSFSANSTSSSSPTTKTLYAHFSEITAYYNSTLTVVTSGDGNKVNVSNTSTIDECVSNTASLSTLNNGNSKHTYYVTASSDDKYQSFMGWYKDEECTQLISSKATFSYTVDAISEDNNNPTEYTLYAKFVNAKYQLVNGNFEQWENVSYKDKTGEEPLKWNSFLDGTSSSVAIIGDLKDQAGYNQMSKETESVQGKYSAKITSRNVLGSIIAQGNLTNGCIHMGSMTATDATGNYNYVGKSTNTRDDQNMKFGGRPDAVKMWIKFKGKGDVGNASVYLLTDGYYQDPEANTLTAKKIAHAKNGTIVSNDEWTQVTVPFTYYESDYPTQVLASFSTNSTPGEGTESDYMYIDDIRMVYNSELSSVEYDGTSVTLNDNTATIDATYNESLLNLTSNGIAATIEKNYDDTTGLLTIIVKGDNISEDASNYNEYTLQFNLKTDNTETYNKYVGVTVNGNVAEPISAPIEVTYHENNTIDFNLKNFCLGTTGVGNITLPGLAYNTTDGTFSYIGNLNITAGDKEGIDPWLGPALGDIPLNLQGTIKDDYFYVTIGIDMTGTTLNQMIDVEVGDLATATVSISSALVSTFCAPFKVAIPSGVTASTVTAADEEGVLTLNNISGIIPAHTPVIIQCPISATMDVEGIYSKGTPTAGMLVGTYEDTDAPADSYILQNQSGKVGFYHVSTTHTVYANRCWLVAPDSSVKAFIIRTDETEGIKEQTTINKQQTIFNLQGQRINNVLKGVNIVNGKKVIR